jgi:hypothetical protein
MRVETEGESWQKFAEDVARIARRAGFDGIAFTAFRVEDGGLDSRTSIVNDPELTSAGKEVARLAAIRDLAGFDFDDHSDTEHRHIDVGENADAGAELTGDVCEECGEEKVAIPPPEGAAEVRDAVVKALADSGIVKVANINLVFNNGCEDVNVWPNCGCGDTTGSCFVHALRTFQRIVDDVAHAVEEDGGFNRYDGDGGEEKVEPLKH